MHPCTGEAKKGKWAEIEKKGEGEAGLVLRKGSDPLGSREWDGTHQLTLCDSFHRQHQASGARSAEEALLQRLTSRHMPTFSSKFCRLFWNKPFQLWTRTTMELHLQPGSLSSCPPACKAGLRLPQCQTQCQDAKGTFSPDIPLWIQHFGSVYFLWESVFFFFLFVFKYYKTLLTLHHVWFLSLRWWINIRIKFVASF